MVWPWRWVRTRVGEGAAFGLLCASHCLPAWFAALCLLLVVSALAGLIHLLVKGTLFWFVCCASRGHRFALGTGGLKQSLLVGGIGPVYSLPKYCFKPFRKIQPTRTKCLGMFHPRPVGTARSASSWQTSLWRRRLGVLSRSLSSLDGFPVNQPAPPQAKRKENSIR